MSRMRKALVWVGGGAVVLVATALVLPLMLALRAEEGAPHPLLGTFEEFPVTVDPVRKTITERDEVNALFEKSESPATAAVGAAGHALDILLEGVARALTTVPGYRNLAAVNAEYVVIHPGMRKEQVANAFGTALGWDALERKEFLTKTAYANLPLPEGSFSPGFYVLSPTTTPLMAQALVNERFAKDILSYYGPETAKKVSLEDALTIASLIEREAGGQDDMRLVSGVIWNRLFIDMPLQIDATVQYAKANATRSGGWWPRVAAGDQFRKSPYNTYQNEGLPPTPISNVSVASVLAALNPKSTSCLFYFHDSARRFHCSDTYQEHVALLKQYFGRGR